MSVNCERGATRYALRVLRAGVVAAMVGATLVDPAWASAQGTGPAGERMQALASGGRTAEARTIADSILADTDPSAAVYAEALYWRGVLSSDARASRLDLLRLVVEHPFASRVPNALYRLAQEDQRAGRTMEARRHLGRIVRDHASSAIGSTAAFELGRMLMASGDMRDACAALDTALAYEPPGSVERRNRIAYDRRPCDRLPARDSVASPPSSAASPSGATGADSTNTVRPAAPARPGTAAPRPTSGSPPASPPASRLASPPARGAPTSDGRWTVQVAAFEVRVEADRLAATLRSRGYDVRVTSARPFRVRIGRFANRADATAIVTRLKSQGTTAIIVEAERP